MTAGPVTIDLDTTDVEVYGREKDGVAYNHQGQRVGRPHVATWAETELTLAADLGSGVDDPRATAPDLLDRALAALPRRIGREQVALRADAGYFAGTLARAAHAAGVVFAIGAKRIAPLWRVLDGIAETDWRAAIDMHNAQVAVADYRPADWPPDTTLLIRRVRLTIDQVSTDSRSRRRRTLHPEQRALPLDELADADAIYAYSFIVTDLDVSTPDRAVATEHWYRHRTSIENIFRDNKHGAALRHLPSGDKNVNAAWTWGALFATNIAAWLHQLTGVLADDRAELLVGHGVRGGKAMIATLRHRLIATPARLIRHARTLTLRPAPSHRDPLNDILDRLRACPHPDPRRNRRRAHRHPHRRRYPAQSWARTQNPQRHADRTRPGGHARPHHNQDQPQTRRSIVRITRGFGSDRTAGRGVPHRTSGGGLLAALWSARDDTDDGFPCRAACHAGHGGVEPTGERGGVGVGGFRGLPGLGACVVAGHGDGLSRPRAPVPGQLHRRRRGGRADLRGRDPCDRRRGRAGVGGRGVLRRGGACLAAVLPCPGPRRYRSVGGGAGCDGSADVASAPRARRPGHAGTAAGV